MPTPPSSLKIKNIFQQRLSFGLETLLVVKAPNIFTTLIYIYGDVFYAIAQNVLQTDNADDFYSKKLEYTTRFIFSEESAVRLFEFLTNLRVKGHTIVNFRSMQNLNITDFVKLRLDNIGIDHFFLILSKKITNFDLDIKLYEYEGIT